MSQILSRHLKCKLGPNQLLTLPRAQMLNFRWGTDARTKLELIEIRLSVGELTLLGTDLQWFWEQLVSGEIRELEVGAEVANDPGTPRGHIQTHRTTLAPEFLQPLEQLTALA